MFARIERDKANPRIGDVRSALVTFDKQVAAHNALQNCPSSECLGVPEALSEGQLVKDRAWLPVHWSPHTMCLCVSRVTHRRSL